jgi:hypothetical protein
VWIWCGAAATGASVWTKNVLNLFVPWVKIKINYADRRPTVYRSDQTAFKNFKFDFEFSEFSATSQGEMFSLAAQRPREVQRNTEQSWIWSVK